MHAWTEGDAVWTHRPRWEGSDEIRPATVTTVFANGKAVEVRYADGSLEKWKVVMHDGSTCLHRTREEAEVSRVASRRSADGK